MGFLKPKIPSPPPIPKPANAAADPVQPPADASNIGISPSASSLITTSVQGLKRKASTVRTSLIGG